MLLELNELLRSHWLAIDEMSPEVELILIMHIKYNKEEIIRIWSMKDTVTIDWQLTDQLQAGDNYNNNNNRSPLKQNK